MSEDVRRASDSAIYEHVNRQPPRLFNSLHRNIDYLLSFRRYSIETRNLRPSSRPLDDSKEYRLCCALAALWNDTYRVLELLQEKRDYGGTYTRMWTRMSIFLRDVNHMSSTEEASVLWSEIDCLIDAITHLAAPSPSYRMQEKTPSDVCSVQRDLDNLLAAIDRLSAVAPSLTSPRAELTEQEANDLAVTTVLKSLHRSTHGRMDTEQVDILNNLINSICDHVFYPAMEDHNESISSSQEEKEATNASGFLCQHDRRQKLKRQYLGKEHISPDQQLTQELCHMTELLYKSLNRPVLCDKQRYTMSCTKERELFLNRLFKRISRMEERRLSNQDAEKRISAAEQELERLFQRIENMRHRLDNQRACFRKRANTIS
ncbi:hypothetical protein EC973_002940 [Apophysomyces ossiformis]|uniref:Uncharacterized protein n=1 Tax=Apophysomyces ossiformis TaxID=679940 RepID=A0A8H7EMA0_9FUNG|nr:hypothetical protein EC973_002940 [Apophysomyces ossiformis]